jgi:hypothetical protein
MDDAKRKIEGARMTDDLVKRLRCYADLNDAVFHPWVYRESADRINQLEDALKEILSLGDWGANILARTVAMEALGTTYEQLNGKEGA